MTMHDLRPADPTPSARNPRDEPSDYIRSVARALSILESIGASQRGMSVKQIARRSGLTVATTYHLIRTLTHKGYVVRHDSGVYTFGGQISSRYRELVVALRGPTEVQHILRRAALETGFTHRLARIIGDRIVITAMAEGHRSPHVQELIPGFDEAAHATALGKALLATLPKPLRHGHLHDYGMPRYTPHALTTPAEFETNLAQAANSGLYVEAGEYRPHIAAVALIAVASRDRPSRRVALGCALPGVQSLPAHQQVRGPLLSYAKAIAEAYEHDDEDLTHPLVPPEAVE